MGLNDNDLPYVGRKCSRHLPANVIYNVSCATNYYSQIIRFQGHRHPLLPPPPAPVYSLHTSLCQRAAVMALLICAYHDNRF